MPFAEAQPGGKSVGVPGNIRMMALAHRAHGKLPWAALFQPAIRLARDGFAITPRLHNSLDQYRGDRRAVGRGARRCSTARTASRCRSGRSSATRRSRLSSSSSPRAARTVSTSAPMRRRSPPTVSGAPHNPAPMTRRRHRVLRRQAARRRCAAPIAATASAAWGRRRRAGSTVFAILKQLERFDLAALGPAIADQLAPDRRIDARSPTPTATNISAIRISCGCRVAGLIDPAYLASRSALISPDRTIAHVAAGAPAGAPTLACAVAAAASAAPRTSSRSTAGATSLRRPRPSKARSARG